MDTTYSSSSCSNEQMKEQLIYFRPMDVSDREEIKSLHEAWFPVRYSDSFYDDVVQNRTGKDIPLYTCVACAVRSDVESTMQDAEIQRIQWAWNRLWESLQVQKKMDDPVLFQRIQMDVDNSMPSLHGETTTSSSERIAGCLVGRFIHSPSNEHMALLSSDPNVQNSLFYIMTLGTTHEFRKCGLATALVRSCIEFLEKFTSCSAIYLHVITYNTPAIQFYEKLGFQRIDEIQDYYNINDKLYNSYLYARYLHSGSRTGVHRQILSICKRIMCFFLAVGRNRFVTIFQHRKV